MAAPKSVPTAPTTTAVAVARTPISSFRTRTFWLTEPRVPIRRGLPAGVARSLCHHQPGNGDVSGMNLGSHHDIVVTGEIPMAVGGPVGSIASDRRPTP